MKVTYNWLKDFVDLKISPAALAQKLTMAGLEVVSLEEAGGDFVFEIETTSNRPDWLSVLGIAREVSAITGAKLKTTSLKETKIKTKDCSPVKISVSDKDDCSFYSARVICDVLVGTSPDWLKKRLESFGCRSVNNVVDITNYVLFQTGQPLHAFDLDALNQKEIIVRRAKTNEKIITIDAQQIILNPETLVIADKDRPVAIAGIMGGKDTEVSFKTQNILLESAVFNPILVRRAKQKLGLQSESAYRFERGVDYQTAKTASIVAQELILKIANGAPCAYKGIGVFKSANPVINLDLAYVNKILGVSIPAVKIKQILNGLGLSVKAKSKNILTVKIPGFRQDLKLAVDLIEEIARIYGYAKIPQTIPAIKPSKNIPDKRDTLSDIKNILSGLGLNEVITYSLVDRNLLTKSGINLDAGLIEILNPLSKEQEVLRPSLLPGLIRCLVYNLDQQQKNIKIFEAANIFSGTANSTKEEFCLGIALCAADAYLLLNLKGILESLFNKLGIKGIDTFAPPVAGRSINPGHSRGIDFIRQDEHKINISIDREQLGFMLDLSSKVMADFDIKNKQVVLAQINLEKLFEYIKSGKRFSGIPKFPAITRDISFLIKDEMSIKDLLAEVEKKGAPLLRQVKVVDYYQGKQIPEGFKGLTVSCVYRLDERTLTEEEITPIHNEIYSLLKERFEVKLR